MRFRKKKKSEKGKKKKILAESNTSVRLPNLLDIAFFAFYFWQ